jgi:hypothetical protein
MRRCACDGYILRVFHDNRSQPLSPK